MKIEKIPHEAIEIHTQNSQYRSYITSLDYTAYSYNNIIKSASPEEKPLISSDLIKIDIDIDKGEKQLKWNSPNISEYITSVYVKVSDLETRLQKSISNCQKIKSIMSTWKDAPLFKRTSELNKNTLLQLEDKQARLETRYKEIKDVGLKIHDLIKVTYVDKLPKRVYEKRFLIFCNQLKRKIKNYSK